MHIYDIESAVNNGVNSYHVTRVITKKDLNIQGVQLISDRYMYVLHNKKGKGRQMGMSK